MPLAEKTIAKPLSGVEVVEAIIAGVKQGFRKQAPRFPVKYSENILDRLRAQMKRDCFLTPHMAYGTYSADTTIRIQYQQAEDIGQSHYAFQAECAVKFENTGTAVKSTLVRFAGFSGELREDIDMEPLEIHVLDEPRPPNQVRIDSHQGVPALTQTPQGRTEERHIRYAPRKPKEATA